MIEANQCEIGDTYKENSTGQLFIVKDYGEMKVFEFYNQPGMYTTALNKKYHAKVESHS